MTCFPYFQSLFFFNHYLSVEGTCCEAPFNMSTLQTGETLGRVQGFLKDVASIKSELLLPARASEQGNVIGLVSIYIRSCHNFFFVIERTRDLIYVPQICSDRLLPENN